MNQLEQFIALLEGQDPSGGFADVRKAYRRINDGKTSSGEDCVTIRIPPYGLDVVFWDGRYKGLVKFTKKD